MNKKIVIINGSGGVGKDTFVDFCKEFTNVRNISSVDKVKEAAKILVNWNGEKDEKSRKLLSDLKRISVEYNDYPNVYIKDSIIGSDNIILSSWIDHGEVGNGQKVYDFKKFE